MNENLLVVDFVELGNASSHLKAAISSLTGQLHQLEQDAAPLVATWDGEAKAAYAQHQTKWTNAANDIKTMLTSIQTAVDSSLADYHSTEKKNTDLFHH